MRYWSWFLLVLQFGSDKDGGVEGWLVFLLYCSDEIEHVFDLDLHCSGICTCSTS